MMQVGDVKKHPTESAGYAAADALHLTINNRCAYRGLRRTTVNRLWEHYSKEELPLKTLRWGDLSLEEVKTVEVQRWLRATDVANGTKAKINCVMSAFCSHAVRWERGFYPTWSQTINCRGVRKSTKAHSERHFQSCSDSLFEPLLDSDEAAQLLKIHPKTLQRMARQKEIPGVQIGRLWRFRRSELNAWLQKIMARG
jgi:excisionase family DNA binding protein